MEAVMTEFLASFLGAFLAFVIMDVIRNRRK